MNDYFEKYYQTKKFIRNKKSQLINEVKSQNLSNISNEIYMPYQSYIFYPPKDYSNIYIDYNYNNTNYISDYYINSKYQSQKKKYNYNSINKSFNKNYENYKVINNSQKYLYNNNNSFNNRNRIKMYKSFNKYNIGNNNIYNTINNYNNYNVHTYNKFIILNTSSNLNNKFYSSKDISSNNFDFNSNSLDLGKNTTSIRNLHLRKLTENLKTDLNVINCPNMKKDKLTYLNDLPVKTGLAKDTKNKKVIKISILNGNAYIARQKDSENLNNNNNFYISNPYKKIEKIDWRNINYKEPPIEKRNYKIIKLDNPYNTINKEKLFNKITKIKTINNSEILTKFNNVTKSQECINSNLNKPPLKYNILNTSLNLNTNLKSNFIMENKTNKTNESMNIIKKINNLKKKRIPLNGLKINQKSQHKPKIQNIQKKKLNLNLKKSNNKSLNNKHLIRQKSKKLFKTFSSKKKKSSKKTFINTNDIEKKEEKNVFNQNSNNTLTISINFSSKSKINDQCKNQMENYHQNNSKSILTHKKDNIGNNFKIKKECELCHAMIISYLYKVHKMIHPTPIFNYLLLGNFNHASNIKELRQLKINYILNVAHDCHNYNLPDDIEELHLMIKDSEDFPIINYFEKGNEFINKCKLMGGTCLVHCKLGVSRSTAFVIAYLIRYENLSTDEAFEFVKKKRTSIKPNDGFMKQLYIYEKIIRENK